LDQILSKLFGLGNIANDINAELKSQNDQLDDLENHMTKVDDNLKKNNRMLKKFVEQSGGGTRWCILIFLFLILMGLIGYIFNLF
jgi:hypothetical protein